MHKINQRKILQRYEFDFNGENITVAFKILWNWNQHWKYFGEVFTFHNILSDISIQLDGRSALWIQMSIPIFRIYAKVINMLDFCFQLYFHWFCAAVQNLRLWNNTLSFHYWQRPGVIRLTKVYIFNVTNPDGFLNGEKPKLVEVGPFVYR